MQRKYDLSEFGPTTKESAPKKYDLSEFGQTSNVNKEGNAFKNMPPLMQFMAKAFPNLKKPVSQGFPEKAAAMGRGFTDIGQGAKQAALQVGELLGSSKPGSAEKYTKQTNAERAQYEKTPESQDVLNKTIRSATAMSPLFAFGLPAATAETLAGKALWGGLGGAAQGTTEFLPDEKNRQAKIVERAGEGTALGVLPSVASKAMEGPAYIKSLFSKADPKKWMSNIQGAHTKLLNQSSDIYNYVKNEVNPRGVGIIDVGKDLIDQAKKYLPKTDASKALIKKAESGDYDALHEVQSDLGKRGYKSTQHELNSERNKGFEMLDVREKINKAIRDKFEEHGHGDLSKLLDEASGKYKTMKEVYESIPAIKKLVGKNKKIPHDPMGLFSEESEPMQRLFEHHPEIQKEMDELTKKEFMKKLLTRSALGLGGAGGTIAGGSYLLDKFG
jgi:hypothetical protein